MSRSFAAVPYADPNAITSGESTVPRLVANSSQTMASGSMRFVYFTAQKSETVNNLRMHSGGTAAAATPTLCRMGLYEVAANGDLTLVASTANDTTLFAAANTGYTRAVTTPYAKVAGQRYALGLLIVTAAATPTMIGVNISLAAAESTLSPRLAAALNSQTDLPASVTSGLAAYAPMLYGAILP